MGFQLEFQLQLVLHFSQHQKLPLNQKFALTLKEDLCSFFCIIENNLIINLLIQK